MSNNGWTPLGKKVDLGREVQGVLAAGSGAVVSAYNLGTAPDGSGVLQGIDPNSALAFYRLQAGQGVTITPSTDGNALLITSSLLASGTPGVMLQSVYDTNDDGVVDKAAAVPWAGITGKPLTFPAILPINESDVTNLVSDLASKVAQTRMINTAFSLEGGGPLSGDLTLSLIGDKANVGPDMRYGTDPTGVLGWYPASVGAGDMTQAVYDKNNNGIVDLAEAVNPGAITTAMLSPGCVTAANLATGAAQANFAYTPVNKVGDIMSGQLAVLMNGPSINPNMYQNAHLFAEVASNGTGYPTISLARLATGGGAVAIWYNGDHQDLNLQYADGTAATLLSSISQISGSQIIAGSIPAGALAAGAAQTNLGYVPIDGTDGGYYAPSGAVVFTKDVGLAAASYAYAPLRVQNTTGAGRPQIGFLIPGITGASLYYETDTTFRYIRNDGVVAVLRDSQHPITNADLAAGTAVANLGYQPVNIAGGTFDQPSLGANIFAWESDMGAAANSYQWAFLQVRTVDNLAGSHAGIGFWNKGRTGCFLYLNDDGSLRYITHQGVVRILSYT